jgi:DNA-binding MarR family transcriptional regulator
MQSADFKVSKLPMFHLNLMERQHRLNAKRVLRRHGIDHRMWRIMVILQEQDHQSVHDLAAYGGFDRSTVSKIVDATEERGLVARRVDAIDRRRSTVSLTDKGMAMIEKAAPDILKLFDAYFADFSSQEVEQFMSMVIKLKTSVQRHGLELEKGLLRENA